MMARGRIKTIIFERVAMMSTIHDLKNDLTTKVPAELHSSEHPQKIHYQMFKKMAATIAVANNQSGKTLKQQLDKLLANNTNQHFSKIAPFAQLPDTGLVE